MSVNTETDLKDIAARHPSFRLVDDSRPCPKCASTSYVHVVGHEIKWWCHKCDAALTLNTIRRRDITTICRAIAMSAGGIEIIVSTLEMLRQQDYSGCAFTPIDDFTDTVKHGEMVVRRLKHLSVPQFNALERFSRCFVPLSHDWYQGGKNRRGRKVLTIYSGPLLCKWRTLEELDGDSESLQWAEFSSMSYVLNALAVDREGNLI